MKIAKSLPLANFCKNLALFSIGASMAATAAVAAPEEPDDRATPRAEVSVGYGHSWTDNPAYISSQGNSDSIDALALDIPYQRRQPTYTWSFQYSPTYWRYRDFKDFDFLEHLLKTTLSGEPSARTSYGVGLTYLRTQSQSVSLDFVDYPQFLTNRTDRESLTADVSVSREVAPRWDLDGGVRARTLQIDPISGFDSGVMPTQLGDQIETGIRAGATYRKSERTSINFGYSLRTFDLDLSGDETMNALKVGANTQVSPETSLSYSAGIVARDNEGHADETEFEVRGSIAHEVKRGTIMALADRSARNGDAVGGGSTVSSVTVRYEELLGRRTHWDASANWALREPVDAAIEDLTLLRGSMSLTVRGTGSKQGWIRQGLGVRLGGTLVDQTGGNISEDESSYYVVSVTILAFLSN